jgi:excisionase family DNA binding protein
MSPAINAQLPLPARKATPPQVAAALGVTPQTIYRWIADGKLTAYPVSARKRFLDLDQVEQMVAAVGK